MFPRTRRAVILLATAMVLAACGGGSDGSATSDGGGDDGALSSLGQPVALLAVQLDEGEGGEDVVSAADTLVADLGEEATGAVLLSLDRGYDVDQILAAAPAGELGADGTVNDDGSAVAPAGEPAGVFEESAEVIENGLAAPVGALVRGLVGGDLSDPKPLSEVTGRARGAEVSDEVLLIMILSLANAGYDIEQITEAIILDNDVVLTSRASVPDEEASDAQRLCPILGDGKQVIVPTNVEGSRCEDLFGRLGVAGDDKERVDAQDDGDGGDGGGASGDPDGTYVIDQVLFEFARYTGSLDLEVDGDVVTATGDLTVDYEISGVNGVEVCRSNERYTISGSGSVDGDQVTVPVSLTNVAADLSGSDCSDSAELQAENIAEATGSDPFAELTGPVGGDALVGVSPEASQVTLDFTRAD